MASRHALALFVLITALGLVSIASADLSVGVKAGDWIEYNVTYTGAPVQGHDIVWARMEITSVAGTTISVLMTSRFADNSTFVGNSTLNLATGDLIDDFIIPADLQAGDTFLDKNLGPVTIERTEQRTYAGAMRSVCFASTSTNTYVWDQATGVSVEGDAQETEYSIHTIAVHTNMWQQTEEGANWPSLFMLAGFIVIVVMTILALVLHSRRKSTSKKM
jgi:hypothetical protein